MAGEHLTAVTDATFGAEVEDHKGLAIVDFWATWCGPCHMVAPILDQLAGEYQGQLKVTKVDVDANQKTAMRFNVRSIPSILFFKDGRHVDTLVGAYPKAAFEQKIKQHLSQHPPRRAMRTSTTRLMNSRAHPRELAFPQVNRLIHRTRLAFIHLDNLLAFAKRDRDGRVDGYITAYLPDECVLLFFRKGEAVNSASLHTAGRQFITITEALKRMRAEVERGELTYAAAPMEQMAWMYQACAAPVEMRVVDPAQPGAFFAAFARDKVSGILELMSNGRVSYVRFDAGRYHSGYFCDKPDVMAIPKFLEAQFHAGADGQPPVLTAATFPYVAELPQQAPNALINTYRELYWRIVDEVDKEFPGEAK